MARAGFLLITAVEARGGTVTNACNLVFRFVNACNCMIFRLVMATAVDADGNVGFFSAATHVLSQRVHFIDESISFFFRKLSHSCSKGTSQVRRKGNWRGNGRGIIGEVNQITAFLDLDSASGGPLLIGTIASEMFLLSAFKASSCGMVLLLFFIGCGFTDRG